MAGNLEEQSSGSYLKDQSPVPGLIIAAPSEKDGANRLKRSLPRLVSIVTPLALLGLWEFSAAFSLIDTHFFPAPSAIFKELVNLFQSGVMWEHLAASLGRIFWGFLLGAVPGVIIGLLMGISPIIRAAIQPIVNATFPIPKIAIFPLFLIIFGLGEGSKIAIIGVAVIYLVLINTVAGVANIPAIYKDVGRNFQASPWLFFRDIALPGALPFIFTGLRLGMGIALLVIVAAEFVSAKSGLGYLVWSSWSVFAVEQMYAGLIVIAILGTLITVGLTELERLAIPWKR